MTAIGAHAGNGRQVSIFTMGSIFGGTGVVGLPTIPRLLRDSVLDRNVQRRRRRRFVLPYFSFPVPQDVSKTGRVFASPETFLINSKEALRHYHSLDLVFNRLYLLGTAKLALQKDFSKGGETQNIFRISSKCSRPAAPWISSETLSRQSETYIWPASNPTMRSTGATIPTQTQDRPASPIWRGLCFLFAGKVMPRGCIRSVTETWRRAHAMVPRHLLVRRDISLGAEAEWSFFEDLDFFAKRFLVWLRDMQSNHGGINLRLFDSNPMAALAMTREPGVLNDGAFTGSLVLDDMARGVSTREMWARLCAQESLRRAALDNHRAFESALYAAAKGD